VPLRLLIALAAAAVLASTAAAAPAKKEPVPPKPPAAHKQPSEHERPGHGRQNGHGTRYGDDGEDDGHGEGEPGDHLPAAPTGLTATATNAGIALSWQASPATTRVDAYEISEDGVVLTRVQTTSYVVTGVPCGTTHQFGVAALDSWGKRSAPATVTVTMHDCEAGGLTVFVSPTGMDAGACTQIAPCASFDFAYHVAAPGATIQLAGGTYPSQTVKVDLTKLDVPSDVVFQPAPGATVQLDGDLVMYGSHAIFRNLHLRKLVSAASVGALTSHAVVFENLDGETFNIGPNYGITIKGGDWGPSLACHARGSAFAASSWCPVGSPYASTGNDGSAGDWENHVGPDGELLNQWPHDIVITDTRIHDQNSTDLDAMHTGGLFLISGHDIAIRNTVFQKNAVYDLQVQDFSSPECCGMTFGPVHDAVLENNWFGAPVRGVNDPGGDTADDGQPEVQLDPRNAACWSNWLIRYNSFDHGLALGLDADACFSNVRVVGNIGEAPGPPQCFTGATGLTWEYNAWLGGTCGPTDVSIDSLPYENAAIGHENYHLTGGAAVDLVPGTDADQQIGKDLDGQTRPLGPARDAGSDELR
jgi:hypothetical protein